MAGGRIPPKRRIATLAPAVFATTPSHSHCALQRPDHALSLFHLPTLKRLPAPKQPAAAGLPRSLALPDKPSSALSGTDAGAVLLHGRVALNLPGAAALVALTPTHALAAGGSAHELVALSLRDASVVHRHSLAVQHRHPLTALAVAPDGKHALVCSQAVTLVDVVSGAVLRRFAGHSTPASSAVPLPHGRRFATATEVDRYVSIWDADVSDQKTGSSAKRRRKVESASVAAVQTLVAPDEGVVALVVDQRETSGVSIAAVLKSGAVGVWRNWTEKGAASPSPCTFVIRPSEQGVAVFGAAFPRVGELAVVYGSSLKPCVHVVALHDVDGESVILPSIDRDILVSEKTGKNSASAKAALVKGSTMLIGSAIAPVPDVVKDKRKPNGAVALNGDAGSMEESDSEDDENAESEEDGEPSIQQKLIALGVSKGNIDIPGVKDFPAASRGSSVLGSRVSVILQAVNSRDSDMFDKSIERVKGKAAIRGTIERLSPDIAAGAFLDMLVERLQKYPTRAETLCQWIREVLHEHAGALISQQRNKALLALLSIVTERTQALEGLSRLEGRLELVVGQAERLKRASRRAKTADTVPMAEYEEEEGSESSEDDDDEESESSDDSEESETGEDSDEEGDEMDTHSNINSDSSDSEGSDSDGMEDDAVRVPAATQKKGVGTGQEKAMKMNGNAFGDGPSSDSEKSSDDGD